jgi:hypothetical protein
METNFNLHKHVMISLEKMKCGMVSYLSGWTILRVNPAHPLKSLSGCLPHPVHIVADEGEIDCLAGHFHFQGVPWPPHNSFRLFMQDLGMNSCGEEVVCINPTLDSCPFSSLGLESPFPGASATQKKKLQLLPMVGSCDVRSL